MLRELLAQPMLWTADMTSGWISLLNLSIFQGRRPMNSATASAARREATVMRRRVRNSEYVQNEGSISTTFAVNFHLPTTRQLGAARAEADKWRAMIVTPP
jgi:hypothetical protein